VPADTQAGRATRRRADREVDQGRHRLRRPVATRRLGLRYASVKNLAGKFVEPTPRALRRGRRHRREGDLTFSAINSKAPTAYPITYQTWVVVYAKQTDAGRARR